MLVVLIVVLKPSDVLVSSSPVVADASLVVDEICTVVVVMAGSVLVLDELSSVVVVEEVMSKVVEVLGSVCAEVVVDVFSDITVVGMVEVALSNDVVVVVVPSLLDMEVEVEVVVTSVLEILVVVKKLVEDIDEEVIDDNWVDDAGGRVGKLAFKNKMRASKESPN